MCFSQLHVPDPKRTEIKELKKVIFVLEILWKDKLGINKTPKAHTVFNHVAFQFALFGGIADKAEDFVKKAHQLGKQLNHLTNQLPTGDYCSQQLIHIECM